MVDYKVEDLKEKIKQLSIDETYRLIYMWIKQEHINLKQFRALISFTNKWFGL